jgi:mono/diheme cytochrome c family protein
VAAARPLPPFALFLLAALPAASAAQDLALGEQVAQGFCLSCHDRGLGPRAQNPLLPKLTPDRFGTPERAYDAVGRLRELNPLMVLPFEGTDRERRALASWLAEQAERNRPPWWRRPVPGGLVLGVLVTAVLWVLVRRARRA